MSKFSIPVLILIFTTLTFSQQRPEDFHLPGDEYYLSKISTVTSLNSQNPASNSVSSILVSGDTVWLGTSRGVSVSFNRGETWTNFYQTAPFGEDGITAIGYYQGTFWAATVTTVDAPGGGTVPKGTGLKFTTDYGITWTSIPQPVDSPDDSSQQYGINSLRTLPITVAEQNVTYDIAFTPGTVWITSFAGGLRKSTDMGQTWQRVILPTDSLDSIAPTDTLRGINLCISPTDGGFCGEGWLNYRAFSVIAVDDTTLYAGTANGINKSTDNGISWIKFNHQNRSRPVSGNFVVALGYNKMNNTLWAATWKAEGQDEYYAVSSSTDGGESWSIFLEEERVNNFGFTSGGDIIAASDNGAFRSGPASTAWILPNSIIDQNGLVVTTNTFYTAASQDNDVWLGSADGLAKNLNSVNGWSNTWKIYFASQPLASKNETYAFPNPFSPALDGYVDLKYSTGGKGSLVTIRIFDFAMNYVRTVIQNAGRGDPVHTVDNFDLETNGVIDKWDGRDENGNIVPNGVYFYMVDFDNNDPVYGKIIVLQ